MRMKPQPQRTPAIRASDVAQEAAEPPASGVVVFDLSLRPIASDDGALHILTRNGGGSKSGPKPLPEVPPEILESIRANRLADNPRPVKSIRVGQRTFRYRTYLAQSENPALHPSVVVLHFDCHEFGNDAIRDLALEHHLTPREQEALRGIALGLTTKELADKMNISPNTVKSFVRLIMVKLGVATRTAIMVKLLERGEGG
jgi:DNA-binding CsgD family transcriptional regulator